MTAFDISEEYFNTFEIQNVGGNTHNELWVPAEQLETFNNKIIHPIRIENAFYGEKFEGQKVNFK